MDKTKKMMLFPTLVTREDFINQNQKKSITHVGSLYYPYWLSTIKVSIKRLGLKPRVVNYGFLLDGINGTAYYVKPNSKVEETLVDTQDLSLMDFAITEEEAAGELIGMAKRKALRKYRTWWMPEFNIINCDQVYIKYWLGKIEGTDKVLHCNSFSGEKELL